MLKIEIPNYAPQKRVEEILLTQSLKTLDITFQKLQIRGRWTAFHRIFNFSNSKQASELRIQIAIQLMSKHLLKTESILHSKALANAAWAFHRLFFCNLTKKTRGKTVGKSKLEIALEEYKIENYQKQAETIRADLESEKRGQLALLARMSEIVEAEINKNEN